jgi:hypothetical protein
MYQIVASNSNCSTPEGAHMKCHRLKSSGRSTGYEHALSIIEKNLDDALERLAREPDSTEARELVAEFQQMRRTLLQAGPTCVRSRRRKGESDRSRLVREGFVATLVAAGAKHSDAEQTSTRVFDKAAKMGALGEGASAGAESQLVPGRSGVAWSDIPAPPKSRMH